MKLKSFTFLATMLLLGAMILKTNPAKSRAAQPPNAGLAGESATCTNCHSGIASHAPAQFELRMNTDSMLLSDASSVVTSATQYVPGTTYFMSLAMTATTGVKYGFQLIPIASGAMSGSIALANTSNTSSITSNGKTYVGHKNASANKTWIFKWTAPATTTDVTFYYAGLVANGNGGDGGDITYKATSVITAQPSGIASVKADIADLSVFPTAATDAVSVKMEVPSAQNISIAIYDLAGNKVKELASEKLQAGSFEKLFSVENLSAGTYFVHISGENCKGASKFIKY